MQPTYDAGYTTASRPSASSINRSLVSREESIYDRLEEISLGYSKSLPNGRNRPRIPKHMQNDTMFIASPRAHGGQAAVDAPGSNLAISDPSSITEKGPIEAPPQAAIAGEKKNAIAALRDSIRVLTAHRRERATMAPIATTANTR